MGKPKVGVHFNQTMKEFIQQFVEVLDIMDSHGGNDMRSEYDNIDELCRRFAALIIHPLADTLLSANGRDELIDHLKSLVEEDEIDELKTFIRSL
jgi:hypothetical protein